MIACAYDPGQLLSDGEELVSLPGATGREERQLPIAREQLTQQGTNADKN